MKLRNFLLTLLSIGAISWPFAQTAHAAPTTINFDDVPPLSDPLTLTVNITNDHYMGSGMRIEDTQYWNGIALLSHSLLCPNNYLPQNNYLNAPLQLPTIDPITKATIPPPPGPIRPPNQNMLTIDFDRPNTLRFINGQVSDTVSFNVINENGAGTAYQALDVSGGVISQGQITGNPCGGVPVTLSKGSSTGINAVRIWRTGAGNAFGAGPGYIGIDDVTFNLTPPTSSTPPAPTPAPTPQPGPFTVSALAVCSPANPTTTVQIDLNWTASTPPPPQPNGNPFNSPPQYILATIDNGQPTPLPVTGELSKQFTEPSGAYTTRIYSLATSNAGGTTFATPGDGTVDASRSGNTYFSVALPNCTPPPPGDFTGTMTTSCNGSNPIAKLDWTEASGAITYRVYDVGTPGDTELIATLQSTDPHSYTVPTEKLRTTLRFIVDASNDGGVNPNPTNIPQDTSVSTTAPNCVPAATIALTPINSACSLGKTSNILVWTSSDGSAGALSDFIVLRGGNQIGTTNNTTYTDTTAAPDASYTYTIQSGETTSNAQSITTTACQQLPASPQLTITSDCVRTTATKSDPANHLIWNVSTGADSYDVHRPDGKLIRSLTKNTNSATTEEILDFDVTSGASYTYLIYAINSVGRTPSNSVTINTVDCSTALPANRPPVANDDSATTDPATKVNVPVLANDTDPDGNLDPSTLRITQNPTNGTATIVPNQTIDYTPNTGFAGNDTLTYEVCDTDKLCDTAILTITVNAKPTPPPPAPGPITLNVQALCSGLIPQNILTWEPTDPKAVDYIVRRGTDKLTQDPITKTTYTDGAVTNGTTYSYTVDATNKGGTTPSNQITIKTANCAPIVPTPTPVPTPKTPQPPVASDDTATTPNSIPVTIDVLANDVDPEGQINPACTKVTIPPTHGTTTVNAINGKVTFTPTAGFSGTDTFVYEMCDAQGLTDTATVTVVVQAPIPTPTPVPTPTTNKPPVANDDAATTPHNKPIEIDILKNDTDPDGNLDPSCVKVVKQPGHGTVAINPANGRATYTPAADFSGTDTLQYTVCDKLAAVSNTATVSIAIGQAPPTALVSTGIPILGYLVDLWNKLLALIGLR